MASTTRRRGAVRTVTVVLLGNLLTAGCAAPDDESVATSEAVSAPGPGDTSEEASVSDRASGELGRPPAHRSGVGVIAAGCGLAATAGSGVFVDTDLAGDVVLTVAHTIKGATDITVIDAAGVEHDAEVLAFDKDADLAALVVPSLDGPTLGLASGDDTATDGAPGSILAWSRDEGPAQVDVVISKRLAVTIEDIYVDEVVERTALEIAGPVKVGDSGGPVLDEDGDVVGIIYASSRGREQIGFATDRREIVDLLATVTGTVADNGRCFK